MTYYRLAVAWWALIWEDPGLQNPGSLFTFEGRDPLGVTWRTEEREEQEKGSRWGGGRMGETYRG